jgi:hypothetical protein
MPTLTDRIAQARYQHPLPDSSAAARQWVVMRLDTLIARRGTAKDTAIAVVFDSGTISDFAWLRAQLEPTFITMTGESCQAVYLLVVPTSRRFYEPLIEMLRRKPETAHSIYAGKNSEGHIRLPGTNPNENETRLIATTGLQFVIGALEDVFDLTNPHTGGDVEDLKIAKVAGTARTPSTTAGAAGDVAEEPEVPEDDDGDDNDAGDDGDDDGDDNNAGDDGDDDGDDNDAGDDDDETGDNDDDDEKPQPASRRSKPRSPARVASATPTASQPPFKPPTFVPPFLRNLDQWVVWKAVPNPKTGKIDKRPVSVATGNSKGFLESGNHVSYDKAVAYAAKHEFDGIGFVLMGNGIVGIDLDKCIGNNGVEPWAAEIIGYRETYAEISPSRRGVHLFAKGNLDGKPSVSVPAQVEMYAGGRYLTFTGERVPGTPDDVRPAPKTMTALKARIDAAKAKQAETRKEAAIRWAAAGEGTAAGAGTEERAETLFSWINREALKSEHLAAWVLELFPTAIFHEGTTGYRVKQADLGRPELQEDLSIHPNGIVDFGVADLGEDLDDEGKDREGKRSPIDLVIEWGEPAGVTAIAAADWLAKRMGLDKGDILAELTTGHQAEARKVFERLDVGAGDRAGDKAGESNPADGESDNEEGPVNLWKTVEAPELPVGLLPPRIEKFVRIIAKSLGADPAGLAGAALAVLAAAIPDSIKLQVQATGRKWVVAPRQWVVLIGDPSSKKTPIMDAALAHLRTRDLDRRRRYDSLKAFWDAQTKQAKATAQTTGQAPPAQNRLIITDLTVEAAGEILATSPNGVLGHHDELTGFFGLMERYSQGKKGLFDRSFWLKARNGGQHMIDRIGRGSVYVPNLSISLLGGIQPEPMRRIAGTSEDDGLIQRFTPIMLRPAELTDDTVDTKPADKDFADLVDSLLALTPGDKPLAFDVGGQKICREMEVEHHDQTRAWERANKKLATAYGKQDGVFAEICVIFHAALNAGQNPLPPIVTETTARQAADFMRNFLRPHLVAFYAGLLDLADEHDRLQAIAGYILVHKPAAMSSRDVQKAVRSTRNLKAREVAVLMEQLEAFGWLIRQPPARANAGPVWKVDSRVHAHFAERKKEEAARRAQDQVIIAKAVRARQAAED